MILATAGASASAPLLSTLEVLVTRMRTLSALVATLALAACAQSPQASPTTQPAPAATPSPRTTPPPTPAATAAGVYDFSTVVQGQEVTGTVTITGSPGSYGGSIVTTATPEIPIKSVTMEGQSITVTADTPDGEVVFQMAMEGMDFSGSWSYAGMAGTMRGRKRG